MLARPAYTAVVVIRRCRSAIGYGWVGGNGTIQEDVNRRIYSSSRIVKKYAQVELRPAETAFFKRHDDAIAERRILELGCGAGRITGHLASVSSTVTGIDVSPAMIEYCRQAIPSGTFVVGDLRDLSAYSDASFDLVVAGANVFDAVSHEDRLKVLAEIRRVLAPEGVLFFSSHNLHSTRALDDARHGPHFEPVRNPYRLLRATARFVQGKVNHRRFAKYQVFGEEHALLNDDAHGWRLLHYYISRPGQVAQLEAAGFEPVDVYGSDGSVLASGDDDSQFTELHYVARAG